MNCQPTEAFLEAISSLVELSPAARQYVSQHLRARQFDCRELLLPAPADYDGVFFVHTGLVRGVGTDARSEDRSEWFVLEGEFIPAQYLMPDGTPALKSIELLEKSVIVWLNRQSLDALYAQCPEAVGLERLLEKQHLAQLTEYGRAFRMYGGRQLYQWMSERFPKWVKRVNNKHLASFMDVTPQAISRIRSERR